MSLRPSGPTAERVLIALSVGMAFGAFICGYYLAYRTHDPHWMNRSGAAIVCFQASIVVVENARRHRLRKLFSKMQGRLVVEEDRIGHHARTFLESEIRRAEINVLAVAIFIGVIGEFLHGFGDLLVECII